MKASINDILNIIKCPITGSNLSFHDNCLKSEEGLIYKIYDGIIDLVVNNNDDKQSEIESSYNSFSVDKYDRVVNNRLFLKLVWGFDKNKISHLSESISEFSDGTILDVPCGTAFFGIEAYKEKPNSLFIAFDYSIGMLKVAKKRCNEAGIQNVIFIRGDVGNLPFKDNSLNGCLSLNGFHAFPKPDEGAIEIGRTLMTNAPMLMTVVCSDERKISDFMINKVMIPRGFFNNSLPMNTYKNMLINANFNNFDIQMLGALMFVNCDKS